VGSWAAAKSREGNARLQRSGEIDRRPTVRVHGRADDRTAFARVNARWRALLASSSRFRLDDSPAAGIVIHHDYESDFAALEPPAARRRIAVRTWDFGPFPRAWAERVNRDWHRLWVHSAWVAEQAVRGGVDPARVAVIPHGVDPAVFRADGPRSPPASTRTFRFLFLGSATRRKGIDVLLRAYERAFTAADDVCLVVKDRATDLFYEGTRWREAILERASSPGHPEIRYVEADLAAEELAALYRGCDVGVFPYRAEGFAIPILEAMGCGLPVVVPRFGACLDYCADERAFFVEAKRIRLPVRRRMAVNTLGFEVEVDEVDFCEVSVEALARTLRAIRDGGVGAVRARGAAATGFVRERFTWAHTLELVERELLRVVYDES
jgi:glycosyltransferase involved in cell wall biosynthesis